MSNFNTSVLSFTSDTVRVLYRDRKKRIFWAEARTRSRIFGPALLLTIPSNQYANMSHFYKFTVSKSMKMNFLIKKMCLVVLNECFVTFYLLCLSCDDWRENKNYFTKFPSLKNNYESCWNSLEKHHCCWLLLSCFISYLPKFKIELI